MKNDLDVQDRLLELERLLLDKLDYIAELEQCIRELKQELMNGD
jgi:hypothetical protein